MNLRLIIYVIYVIILITFWHLVFPMLVFIYCTLLRGKSCLTCRAKGLLLLTISICIKYLSILLTRRLNHDLEQKVTYLRKQNKQCNIWKKNFRTSKKDKLHLAHFDQEWPKQQQLMLASGSRIGGFWTKCSRIFIVP